MISYSYFYTCEEWGLVSPHRLSSRYPTSLHSHPIHLVPARIRPQGSRDNGAHLHDKPTDYQETGGRKRAEQAQKRSVFSRDQSGLIA